MTGQTTTEPANDSASTATACEQFATPYRHAAGSVVAAALTPDGTHLRVLAPSRPPVQEVAPVTPDTLFELGSITKVFTAILLAVSVRQGLLDWDEPIAADAAFAGTPSWITARALATHTSGLPRVPFSTRQLLFGSATDPYADFDEEALCDWLRSYRPRRAPRTARPAYSNLGVGLLGAVLARRHGCSWFTALEQHVLQPLALTDITVGLSEEQTSRFAQPYRPAGTATPPWTFAALAGAGALRGSANDLLRFAAAVIAGYRGDGPLAEAMVATCQHHAAGKPPPDAAPRQCLGWLRLPTRQAGLYLWHHDGGTLGSSSALYVAPSAGCALLALANSGWGLRRQWRILRSNPQRIAGELAEAYA